MFYIRINLLFLSRRSIHLVSGILLFVLLHKRLNFYRAQRDWSATEINIHIFYIVTLQIYFWTVLR